MADIVDIRDIRFQRKRSTKKCAHRQLLYDEACQTIECRDCGNQLSPFKAFLTLIESFQSKETEIQRKFRALDELKKKNLVLIAAKKAERAWRSRNVVPTCPHCGEAIFPEDGFGGTMVDKQRARQIRKFKAKDSK